MSFGLLIRYALFWGSLIYPVLVTAQDKAEPASKDTSYTSRVVNFVGKRAEENIAAFRTERLQLQQQRLIERIRHTVEDVKSTLREGVDTVGIRLTLDKYQQWNNLLEQEMPGNPPALESYRNLNTISKGLEGLKTRVAEVRDRVYNLSSSIESLKFHLDSLSSDTLLVAFPSSDSATVARYFSRLSDLAAEVYPIDSSLAQASLNLQGLVNRSNLMLARLTSQAERMEVRQAQLSNTMWRQDVPYLWSVRPKWKAVNEVVVYSLSRTAIVLRFYLANNAGFGMIVLFAIIVSSVYLRALRRIVNEEHLLQEPSMNQLALRYPVLTAIVICISILQFIFIDPPAVFTIVCTGIASFLVTFIFRNLIHRNWMRNWLLLLGLFIISSAINVVLVGSHLERWMMLVMAVAGIIVCANALLNDLKSLTEKRLIYFLVLIMVMELLSIICNITGRYNLSKNLLTTGYLGFVVAVQFLWTVRFINEALELSYHVYTLKDRSLFSINFEKVGTRAPGFLYALLVVGWVVMVSRNFYVYRLVADPLSKFVIEPRSVGDYSFSIASILTFIIIMFVAAVVSRVVSFFASDRPQTKGEGGGLGSLLLLVRIGIFGLGLFLAFAAAGIPVDKVTIILGALSVGIGFGLQTLVNNLVSGLILAFERPVNVGDIVEINGQSGVMKSIGFRSSRISTWDGADVIMPNGDLLAGHMVNWSGGDPRRRIDIELGVAYGSDLAKVERIIREVLQTEQKVVIFPEPLILFKGFGESSIDVKVLVWVSHFRERLQARSKLIVAIDAAFRANNITIPFPQRDLNIVKAESARPKDVIE